MFFFIKNLKYVLTLTVFISLCGDDSDDIYVKSGLIDGGSSCFCCQLVQNCHHVYQKAEQQVASARSSIVCSSHNHQNLQWLLKLIPKRSVSWNGYSVSLAITHLWYYWWIRQGMIGTVCLLAGWMICTGSSCILGGRSGIDLGSS